MYIDNVKHFEPLQELVLMPLSTVSRPSLRLASMPMVEPEEVNSESDESDSVFPSPYPLDPVGEHVLDLAYRLLTEKDHISIKDFLENDTVQIGESALRDRLNRLAESGRLGYLPGSGRRPNYYFSPGKNTANFVDDIQNQIVTTDEEILERVKVEEESVQKELEVLQQRLEGLTKDREALERAIDVKRRYTGA